REPSSLVLPVLSYPHMPSLRAGGKGCQPVDLRLLQGSFVPFAASRCLAWGAFAHSVPISRITSMLEPSYVRMLESGELESRVENLMAMLAACRVCPRDCGNNRFEGELAACYSGLLPIVSSYTAHFGEEPVLVGSRGAGNVFLGLCNLRCVYCQNYQISQTFKEQRQNEVSFERLAGVFL